MLRLRKVSSILCVSLKLLYSVILKIIGKRNVFQGGMHNYAKQERKQEPTRICEEILENRNEL